jgi:hypothetical protein
MRPNEKVPFLAAQTGWLTVRARLEKHPGAAAPPLLAVMQGGEIALTDVVLTLSQLTLRVHV